MGSGRDKRDRVFQIYFFYMMIIPADLCLHLALWRRFDLPIELRTMIVANQDCFPFLESRTISVKDLLEFSHYPMEPMMLRFMYSNYVKREETNYIPISRGLVAFGLSLRKKCDESLEARIVRGFFEITGKGGYDSLTFMEIKFFYCDHKMVTLQMNANEITEANVHTYYHKIMDFYHKHILMHKREHVGFFR